MAIFLPYTGATVIKILDGRLHSPTHDVTGDNYSAVENNLLMDADTEYLFECNGNVRDKKIFPDHVTKLWDTATNKTHLSELLDTPQMVFNLTVNFDPTVSAAGVFTFQPYVDEDTPIPFKARTTAYKTVAGEVTALITIYAGNDTGFDVKNNNVFFKMKSSGAGKVYGENTIEIYRT